MAREFARAFYHSPAWKRTRAAYLRSVNGLCEDCLAEGRYRPAEIVHHVRPLTPDNIDDPATTTGFGNLRAVCRECHAREHEDLWRGRGSERPLERVMFDDEGNTIPKEGQGREGGGEAARGAGALPGGAGRLHAGDGR